LSNRRITVLLVGAALVLAFGAGIGSAAGNSAPTGAAKPAVTRDHGRGHWYERACDAPKHGAAACEAQVVAAADGTPLATGTPPAAALGPAQFHSAYNLPTTAPNAQTVAIVDAYDDPNIESDLANYSSYYGLPACTTANGCFKKVNQSGGTLYPIKDPGWSLEIALDVETAHAICQNCKILLVEASTATTANLYAAENEAAALGATVISNSWLTSEYSGETVDDVNFNHPGVAITASSGDNGYGVGYPAASRYVTAVGGTTLALGSGGSYGGESAWSGSGSGCSAYEPKPSWQTDTGCSRRSVADVSADADPNSGAAVYDTVSYVGQTGWFQVGGTSLSSPLVASVFALTGSHGGPSAPYGNAGLLHDVTSGSNGSCSPTYLCTGVAGYDGPTGLGSPNGIGAFSGGSAPAPDFSLNASPASQTVTAGGGTTYSVSVAPSSGFSSSVALSASGLPAGVTASFSPTSTTTSSTLTIATTAAAAAGSYTVTITGTSGSLTHSTTVTLVVQAAASSGDFSLAATPASQTVTAGSGTTYSVSVTSTGGFSGSVALSASGLPAGVTASFSPASTTTSSTLTVTTSAVVAAASYPFTITGKSGSLTHTTGATLVVQPASATGDFSLSASPASQKAPAGFKSVSYTITVVRGNGFTGSVTLSVGALPPVYRVVFAPNPTTATARMTLTGPGGGSTASTITITGTSGALSHSTTVTLIH
jgi:subtilase family serine protease